MQTTRMQLSDLDWATELLTAAFAKEAPADRMFTGPNARAKTAYFMRCGCKYALLFGECYASADRTGVALWLLPGATAMTPGRMFRAGMFAAPAKFGLADFARFLTFVGHTDKRHREAAPMPHYYLLTLGVDPAAQGRGVGSALLVDMLGRTDRERLPVFLETQSEANVGLYERHGFGVASRDPIPKLDGLDNMAMIRMPQHA